MLESLENVLASNRQDCILAEILGFGQAADAFGITAPDPDGDGAERSMRNALRSAKLDARQIDVVFAHATSTKLGDHAEALAIARTFPHKPIIAATKGALGHLLGASGALDAAFASFALLDQQVPPILNTTDSEYLLNLNYSVHRKANLRFGLINSFGFGGVNTSLVLANYSLYS